MFQLLSWAEGMGAKGMNVGNPGAPAVVQVVSGDDLTWGSSRAGAGKSWDLCVFQRCFKDDPMLHLSC